MSNFVKVLVERVGYKSINLDHVSRIEWTATDKRIFYLAIPDDADGSNVIVGEIDSCGQLAEEELFTPSTVIKADPGYDKIEIFINHTNKTYALYKDPILAWKIFTNTKKAPRPITPSAYQAHLNDDPELSVEKYIDFYGIMHPTGVVACEVPEFCDDICSHYPTVGEFVSAVLKEFKASSYKLNEYSTFKPEMPAIEADVVEGPTQASFVSPAAATSKPTSKKQPPKAKPIEPDLWG